MLDVNATIAGIQEAQARNLRMIAALKPEGALGRAVQYMTIEAHRYAVIITHVESGALRASHRMDVDVARLRGQVYIDPGSVNPRGKKPSVYGPIEHARGGDHAFYHRTVIERGPVILQNGMAIVRQGLK